MSSEKIAMQCAPYIWIAACPRPEHLLSVKYIDRNLKEIKELTKGEIQQPIAFGDDSGQMSFIVLTKKLLFFVNLQPLYADFKAKLK